MNPVRKTVYNQNVSLIILACIFLFVTHLTMPIVGYFTPAAVYLIEILLLLIWMVSSRRNFNRVITFAIPVMLPALIGVAYGYFQTASLTTAAFSVYTELQNVLWAMIAYYLIQNRKHKAARFLTNAFIITLLITAVTTIIGVYIYPNASRMLAKVIDRADAQYIAYMKFNIGGFNQIYGLTLLFPLFFLLWRRQKINTIIFSVLSVIIIATVIATEYTMAVLCVLFTCILFIGKKKWTLKQINIFMVLCFISIGLLNSVMSFLFEQLAGLFVSTEITDRLSGLSSVLGGVQDEGDTGYRLMLYVTSINNFLQSPIWGTGRIGGGHSYILDTLSQFGMIGGFALFLLYRQIYRKLYKPFRNLPYYGYFYWIFLLSIILAILNTKPFLFIIACIVPLVAFQQESSTISETR